MADATQSNRNERFMSEFAVIESIPGGAQWVIAGDIGYFCGSSTETSGLATLAQTAKAHGLMDDGERFRMPLNFANRVSGISANVWQIAAGEPIAFPLPRWCTEVLSFTGRWSGELQPERQALGRGIGVVNRAGNRIAPDAFPGLVIGESGFGEDHGEVLGIHLAALADFDLTIRRGPEGDHLLEANGPEHGETSALYVAWSRQGLNGLRRVFQDAYRVRFQATFEHPHPVQLNTWEGVYFNHDLDHLTAMAKAGAALGVEHFVLDDGWFGRRSDDARGLGDWQPRADAYPDGLTPLITAVQGQGLSFGLWLEPEMVNRNSALFEAHPDWIWGKVDQPLGRGQYGLDLSHAACEAHIQGVVDEIAAIDGVQSLKWDCNRDLKGAVPEIGQTAHSLMARASEHVPIEACASGGGRLSWGFGDVAYRYWLSDAHDPDIKLPMLAQASLFFPAMVLGTHVGGPISHLTGRAFPLETRAAVAMLGHMGLELDPTRLKPHETDILKAAIADWKTRRDWLKDGHFLVLPRPDPGLSAVGVFSADRTRALIVVLQRETARDVIPAPLRCGYLKGKLKINALNPDPVIARLAKAQPSWLESGAETDAETLSSLGLPLPVLQPGRCLVIDIAPTGSDTEQG